MSNSLAPVPVAEDALLPSPQTWSTMLSMASELVKSGLLPDAIKTPAAALAVMQKGRELGIPPMAAMNGIAVIKGKPTCSAELMLALIRRDHGPGAIRVKETTNEACTVEWRDTGWSDAPRGYTFTLDDAKRAGLLNNPTWTKYPAAMLRARCISAVARMAFPECIGGMHTADEVGATVEVTPDGEVIPVTAAPINLREVHATPANDAQEPTIQELAQAVLEQRRQRFGNIPRPQPTDDRINQSQMNRLHAAADRWNYDHEAVRAHAKAEHGVASTKDLTAHQAAQEITWWETADPEDIHERMGDLLAPEPEVIVPADAEIVDAATGEIVQPPLNGELLDWRAKIDGAGDNPNLLSEVGVEMSRAGVNDRETWERFRRAKAAAAKVNGR